MRRLVAWIGGALGGIAAYRLLRRRPLVEPPLEPDVRADELRAKLADSRSAAPTDEPVVEEPPLEAAEPESPDERRRQVHEEGRAALDDMQGE